jgi:hypothetical protein
MPDPFDCGERLTVRAVQIPTGIVGKALVRKRSILVTLYGLRVTLYSCRHLSTESDMAMSTKTQESKAAEWLKKLQEADAADEMLVE